MSHFLADDGEKLHVQVSGDGPPLIMLHGWTASHHEWAPFLGVLNTHHRVYRWDARGHGGHALTQPAQPTVSRMARDFKNLVDHFALENATAVGHSMGALTLWEYLRHYDAHGLGKVAFIDQSPRLMTGEDWPHGIYGDFDRQRATRFVDALHDDFAETVLRLGAHGLNNRAQEKYIANHPGWQRARENLRQQTPGPLIACWESLTAADYRDVLARIPIPALLIYGGESNFYHPEVAHWVHATIPDAVLHIYDQTDHSPHQWQRERFVRDLLDFISSRATQARSP